MPDVTKLIEQEHREVEALFQNFKDSGDAAFVSTICDELDAHAAAEEEAFYPVVRDDVTSGKKLANEAKNEHGEARQLIGRIRRTSDPDHIVELVNELEQAVNHHVEEEEKDMLPRARDALGEDRLLVIPVGRSARSSLSRSVRWASRPGQQSPAAVAPCCDRLTKVTRSPRAAARIPSTICGAGIALEMKPRAPALTRELARAKSSEKLNTMMVPFAASEAS